MAQTSIDIERGIERRWRFRSSEPVRRLPQNDNNAGAGRCPVCKGLGPFAPEEAEYRGKGVIHHHWQCASCGHDWVTIMHVLV
jgi:hypothetical protein